MEVLNIYQEDQLFIEFYEVKDLVLLKIENMMDTKEVLLLLFINFLL